MLFICGDNLITRLMETTVADLSKMGVEELDLAELSVDDLLLLRERISQMLPNRVEVERRQLETRLARLDRFKADEPIFNTVDTDTMRIARGGRVVGERAVVAPKYRNPENSDETWSGRGRQPRWLVAALKKGKKLRDFAIVENAARPAAVRSKRRARK